MPAFSKTQLVALKREMRRAASTGYRFADAAVAALVAETGLTSEQVRLWVKDVLGYYDTDERKKRFLSETRVCFIFEITLNRFGDFPVFRNFERRVDWYMC